MTQKKNNIERLEEISDQYRSEFRDSLLMTEEFKKKDGYIRQKQGYELSIQDCKKDFGGFKPSFKKEMKNNTNNGQGSWTKDGKHFFPNQLALYDEVVRLNDKYGRFWDEGHIESVNTDDYNRLKESESALAGLTKDFKQVLGSSKERYSKIREIESEVRTELNIPAPGSRGGHDHSRGGYGGGGGGGGKNGGGPYMGQQPVTIPLLEDATEILAQGVGSASDSVINVGKGVLEAGKNKFGTGKKGGGSSLTELYKDHLEVTEKFINTDSDTEAMTLNSKRRSIEKGIHNEFLHEAKTAAENKDSDAVHALKGAHDSWKSSLDDLTSPTDEDSPEQLDRKQAVMEAIKKVVETVTKVFNAFFNKGAQADAGPGIEP